MCGLSIQFVPLYTKVLPSIAPVKSVSDKSAKVGTVPLIVTVSPDTAVVIFVPPAIVSVSVLLSAAASPESDCTLLNAFWLASPLSASPL